MFLRSLYGSRMPQARHPRADEQVSNYWRDDTESAREMARMMDELEASDSDNSGNNGDGTAMKKPTLPAVMAEDATTSSSRGRGNSLLNRALLAHVNAVAPLDTLDTLNVDDVNAATAMLQAQLSPTGLISIAAADIDDATRAGTESLSVHAELDLERLHSIRRAGKRRRCGTTPRNFLERLLASSPNPIALSSSPPSSSSSQQLSEEESPLRFLSLLRRINELRSQQVQQDADVWDGLPYPQILALPTFKYTMRERAVTQQCDDDHNDSDGHINNTMCAVCYTEYEQDEEVRALPCLHFYHRECIDQWLLHHRMCPICKHIVAVY